MANVKLYIITPQYDNQCYAFCAVAAHNEEEALQKANELHSNIYTKDDYVVEVDSVPGYAITLTPAK
jgi:hypothetical protein